MGHFLWHPKYNLTRQRTAVCKHVPHVQVYLIWIEKLTTTAYNPRPNRQVERYNRTLISRLRLYAADHEQDWDKYVQLLRNAYYCEQQRSANGITFSCKCSRYAPGPTINDSPSALRTDDNKATIAMVLGIQPLEKVVAIRTKVSATLQQQKIRYNRNSSLKVWLFQSSNPHNSCGSTGNRWQQPFTSVRPRRLTTIWKQKQKIPSGSLKYRSIL